MFAANPAMHEQKPVDDGMRSHAYTGEPTLIESLQLKMFESVFHRYP